MNSYTTTIKTLKIGNELTYNYYGKTYTGIVKSIRNHTMSINLYLVYTEQHEIAVDYNGNGTGYNDFNTSFVKCDDTDATRAAFEALKPAFNENSTGWKQLLASVRIS